jgi:hypothetical protein
MNVKCLDDTEMESEGRPDGSGEDGRGDEDSDVDMTDADLQESEKLLDSPPRARTSTDERSQASAAILSGKPGRLCRRQQRSRHHLRNRQPNSNLFLSKI